MVTYGPRILIVYYVQKKYSMAIFGPRILIVYYVQKKYRQPTNKSRSVLSQVSYRLEIIMQHFKVWDWKTII